MVSLATSGSSASAFDLHPAPGAGELDDRVLPGVWNPLASTLLVATSSGDGEDLLDLFRSGRPRATSSGLMNTWAIWFQQRQVVITSTSDPDDELGGLTVQSIGAGTGRNGCRVRAVDLWPRWCPCGM